MKTVAGIVLLAATAGAACLPSDETWTTTIADRTVQCCARHGGGGTGTYDLDQLTFWCPRTPRPSLSIDVATDPETGVLVAVARGCRTGPRLRRPPRLKPPFFGPRPHQCCPISMLAIAGPLVPRDSVTGIFLPAEGPVTGFAGDMSCHRRRPDGRIVGRIIPMAIGNGPCAPPLILPGIDSKILSGEEGDISIRGLFIQSAGTPCGGGIFVGSTRWRPDTRTQDVLVTGACTGTLTLARESVASLLIVPMSFTVQGTLTCGCCGAVPIEERFPPR